MEREEADFDFDFDFDFDLDLQRLKSRVHFRKQHKVSAVLNWVAGLVRDDNSTQESSSESLVTFGWKLTNKYYSVDLTVSTVSLSRLAKPWMTSLDVSKAEVFLFVVNLADMPGASKVAEIDAYLSDVKAFYRELLLQRPSSPEVELKKHDVYLNVCACMLRYLCLFPAHDFPLSLSFEKKLCLGRHVRGTVGE